jgi:small GTP-binding protein
MSALPDAATNTHKVVFLGDSNTGKTSLISKFLKMNDDSTPTVGASSFPMTIPLPNASVPLCVWDTAGQEHFRSLVPIYARGAEVACVVFDQSNQQSFESLPKWLEYIEVEIGIKNIIIVSNKCDLETVVSFNKAFDFCCDRNLLMVATSAKTGTNVNLLFTKIAEQIYENKYYRANLDDHIDLSNQETSKKSCC